MYYNLEEDGSITFQDGTTQNTAVTEATTNLVKASLLSNVTAASSGTILTLFSEIDLAGYNLALIGTIIFLYSDCTITNVQIKVLQVDTIIFNYIQSSQLTAPATPALYSSTPFSVSYIPILGAIIQVQVLVTYIGTSPNIQFLGTSTSSNPTAIQISYFG